MTSLPGPREWSPNQVVRNYLFAVTTNYQQLLPYNADRISLLVAPSVAGSNVYVALNGGLTQPNGIPLSSTLPPLILTFAQHGDMVKQPLWGAFPAGAANLYVVETVWLPQVGA